MVKSALLQSILGRILCRLSHDIVCVCKYYVEVTSWAIVKVEMPDLDPKHEISLFFSICANLEFLWIICVFTTKRGGDAHHVESSNEFTRECNNEHQHKNY